LYIMISLAINYGLTMAILELIFVNGFAQEGLKWSVSFFVFLIIVALGVDYSIFLMARFKEEYELLKHSNPATRTAEAMRTAMRTTGGVIISAAVIMGGTFSALMLAGMYTLAQIGAGILIGLLIYAFLFMGFFVPALANLIGAGNFWPFNRQVAIDEEKQTDQDIDTDSDSDGPLTKNRVPEF
jgi:putative drug exporter of the RND superfamily